MSINRVVISGNLTRDPELTQAGQTPLLKIGVAVNDRRKDQASGEWVDVPNFFDVLIWGARGESLNRFLKKGAKVAISGKLKWSSWETDSGKRSKVEIVADEVELMGKASNSNDDDAPSSSTQFTDDIPFV